MIYKFSCKMFIIFSEPCIHTDEQITSLMKHCGICTSDCFPDWFMFLSVWFTFRLSKPEHNLDTKSRADKLHENVFINQKMLNFGSTWQWKRFALLTKRHKDISIIFTSKISKLFTYFPIGTSFIYYHLLS